MDVTNMFPEGTEFFPEHPDSETTRRIQTTPSPLLEQEAPFEVKELYDRLEEHLDEYLPIYTDRRFQVTGVAVNVEKDLHGLAAVQLSDHFGGRVYAHCIFPTDDVLEQVKLGQKVVILSNYLVFGHPFGVTMKFSELVSVGESDREVLFDCQPTRAKIRKVEFEISPLLEQDAPFEVKALYESFYQDFSLLKKYDEKRFEVTGIVTKVGPDMHNLPSVELSDEVGGKCYALCIFPKDDILTQAHVGDKLVIRANYLSMSTQIGVIFKQSELISIVK